MAMSGLRLQQPVPRPGETAGRGHTERLVLSTIQAAGEIPGSEIARLTGLTAQTVSVILRRLEAEGLVRRGEPVRGAVGKPRVPMALHPDGAFSIGIKVGRRTAEAVLLDLTGAIRAERQCTYAFPTPETVFAFIGRTIADLSAGLAPHLRNRIAGVGIGKPFELWNWHDSVGAPARVLDAWREVDFAQRVEALTTLPVLIDNDATAAARAEHLYGRGQELRDFAYIFIGAFIGGGLILGGEVFEGRFGNAGAFGPLPSRRPDGSHATLIDTASLYTLESALAARDVDPARLWENPLDWTPFEPDVAVWVEDTGGALAQAIIAIGALLDFEAVVIDGHMPRTVQARLIDTIRSALAGLDSSGVILPEVLAGRVGAHARPIGAACKPLQRLYFTGARPAEERVD